MLNIIIVIAVVAIGILLVLRARNAKQSSTKTNKKTSVRKQGTTKKEIKEPEVEKAPEKPKIDIDNIISQLEVLIADKQFAKAEGIINATLNKDASLHALYPQLLNIYHLQEDEFAAKQLLQTVQELALNEVYQELYNTHEIYKEEKVEREKLQNANKVPDIIEFTPTSAATTSVSDFDNLVSDTGSASASQDTSLQFEQINIDSKNETEIQDTVVAPSEENTSTTLAVEPLTNELEFNFSTPSTETSTLGQSPTLEFKLDTPPTDTTPVSTRSALEFSLDAPAIQTSSPSLDFSLAEPTPSPVTEIEPVQDLQTSDVSLEETPAVVEEPSADHSASYLDADDPIAQAFPSLHQVNPIDLDLDLAEQYAKLGAFDAARSLISTHQNQLDTAQNQRAVSILQKIAS